jgi:hypothetical protein
MSKDVNAPTILKIPAIGIALIQFIDIIIHAATNQLEFLRVSSNIVILIWLAILFLSQINAKPIWISMSGMGLYLLLNLVFLAREGLTNPAQGGAPRVTLFALVILTTILSTALSFKYHRGGNSK